MCNFQKKILKLNCKIVQYVKKKNHPEKLVKYIERRMKNWTFNYIETLNFKDIKKVQQSMLNFLVEEFLFNLYSNFKIPKSKNVSQIISVKIKFYSKFQQQIFSHKFELNL
ncbi:hypothetical protein BpHYR1_037129 [Brachionus plicatilis]|uniref:Uncharacterized protein n=1 Tax=Brachionus plicatilis TaxID=10195 RepID=A0A3M7SYR6_BRAPC|nr:hypothetical protein BpHYR1_037129 [Brachionus plicatilis]